MNEGRIEPLLCAHQRGLGLAWPASHGFKPPRRAARLASARLRSSPLGVPRAEPWCTVRARLGLIHVVTKHVEQRVAEALGDLGRAVRAKA